LGSLSYPTLVAPHSSNSPCIIALFCSKEGAPQVRLKLALFGDETGHNFTFTAPQPVAVAERQKFKQELTSIISRNKSTTEGLPKPLTPLKVANTPSVAATPTPSALSPKQHLAPSHHPISRASSDSSERKATPVITGSDPASDFRLRKKVLMSNPELGSLHRDLVMTGQITETEFWDGREVTTCVLLPPFLLTPTYSI
jgi:transcription initiation factor TFIIH subunit 1